MSLLSAPQEITNAEVKLFPVFQFLGQGDCKSMENTQNGGLIYMVEGSGGIPANRVSLHQDGPAAHILYTYGPGRSSIGYLNVTRIVDRLQPL